ncbi:hypothetical protein MCOR25_002171 [Pyricularia grisea]|uniref:Heterokaryon incompatibility domain-containing protein n=1 Tax=Pyricularia grisea TaxID=148305 RepID=A0A6P8BDI4_PYRGI|nr:uncharacterized protein PgNI_02954 [Pyricularia grisea]KAI6378753.1 hypothetical protein MCOR25_002171 [Pyricularia grisea]TLD13936.1 hypothetical protein PgNI_02954 [Pyricularia grisea]
MYCDICIQALRDGFHNDESRHHRTFASFKASASSFCAICSCLWEKVTSLPNGFGDAVQEWIRQGDNPMTGDGHIDDYATIWRLKWGSNHKFSLIVACNTWNVRYLDDLITSDIDTLECEFGLVNFTDETAEAFFLLGTSTFTEPSKNIAGAWIQDCIANHESCSKPQSVAECWLPTRLIDVGDEESNTVRVVTTAEETRFADSPAQYATLSHCWGDAKFLKLYRSNLSHLHNGIPLTDLAKTFQEAIRVCHHFKIRYIWIDSLCIIQDENDDDWSKESTNMDKVYANGFINIAAAASHDSSQGLFRQRNPGLSPVYPPVYIGSSNSKIQQQKYLVIPKAEWKNNVERSPLGQRGWVFQERLLSPRILFFGARQLYWQCGEKLLNEEGTPMERLLGEYDPDAKLAFTRMLNDDVCSEDILNLWCDIVMAYSQTKLTKDTDRLVALSGLAKVFGSKLPQHQYVAGLWQQSSLFRWRVESTLSPPPSSPARKDDQKYCAPSFCWASADLPCRLSFESEFEKTYYTILDMHLSYATKDPTGQVVGGHLDVLAKLKLFRFGPEHSLQAGTFVSYSILGIEVVDGTPKPGEWFWMEKVGLDRALDFTVNAEQDYFLFVAGVDHSYREFDMFLDSDLFLKVDADEEFKNLVKEHVGEGDVTWVYASLRAHCVLLAVVDADAGIYRRIGTAISSSRTLTVKGFERSLQYRQHDLLTYETPQITIPHRGMRGEEHVFRII